VNGVLWHHQGVNEQENRERLGEAIAAARLRKFKTVDKARVAAGIARGTWEKAESGEKIKPFSLASIEEALDWPVGRARAILAGAEVVEELDDEEVMRKMVEIRLADLERRLAVVEGTPDESGTA
jgi:hypothetical protein